MNRVSASFVLSTRIAAALVLIAVALSWTFPTALHAQSVTFTGSGAVNFGSVNICPAGSTAPSPCSKTETLTYIVTNGTTIASIKYLTTGDPNLDFKAKADDTSTTLCKAQAYDSATTCTVDVTFAPLAPGARNGAIEILDGSDNVLANTYIYGTGTGPAIAFIRSPQIFLGSGFYHPEAVAVDASGNLFVGDVGNHAVKEIVAVNGTIPANPTIHTLGSAFIDPFGVALDGSGNVFVADYGGGKVYEILAAGGYVTVKTLGSDFTAPQGVAVDGSGNVFVADYNSNQVKEILAAGGYTTVNILGSGTYLESPNAIAVDGSYNVFVIDVGSSLTEILAAGGYTTRKNLYCCFGDARGLALDASGNVYVGDIENLGGIYGGILWEVPAADGYATADILSQDFTSPAGVAVDERGNVYVGDSASTGVVEIPRSHPPLQFGNIAFAGSETQSITIHNIGGGTLTVAPSINGPSYTITSSTCAGGVTAGNSCMLEIEFSPVDVSPHDDILTLTTNGATNPAVSLFGKGTGVGATATILQFGTIAYGSNVIVPLTIRNEGVAGTVMVSESINGPSYKVLTTAQNTCLAGIAAYQNCVLPIEFDPVSAAWHIDTLTVTSSSGTISKVELRGLATTAP